VQPTMSHASDGEDVEAQLQDPSSKVSDMCCIYVSHGGASDGLHKLCYGWRVITDSLASLSVHQPICRSHKLST